MQAQLTYEKDTATKAHERRSIFNRSATELTFIPRGCCRKRTVYVDWFFVFFRTTLSHLVTFPSRPLTCFAAIRGKLAPAAPETLLVVTELDVQTAHLGTTSGEQGILGKSTCPQTVRDSITSRYTFSLHSGRARSRAPDAFHFMKSCHACNGSCFTMVRALGLYPPLSHIRWSRPLRTNRRPGSLEAKVRR